MKAYVLIRSSVGEISQVVRMLRNVKGVVEVDGTFGRWDTVAVVEADTLEHLGGVVYDGIQATPGVKETVTLPVVTGR
jgi:DNA-binding Lrp family transcriptional regulator